MKTKRLFNTSAYKTSKILESVLRDTGFRVYPELALSTVLAIDGDTLSRPERNMLNKGSFDFVVYSEESFPEFAVEFDGPDHQKYEKTKQADIRKNLLCCKAGLPILRIDDNFLTAYEKSCLLEFVIRRFVDWRNAKDQISEEESDISNYLARTGASEEDYDEMMEPQIMWDLEHPFPASLEIAQSLYTTYGIISSHVDTELYAKVTSQPQFLSFDRDRKGEAPMGLYHYTLERGYELRRISREPSGKQKSEHVHFVNVGVTYQWRLPTVDIEQLRASNKLIVENAHGQDLPGISMSELADHFCDFLALNRLREWTEHNPTALDGK